MLYETIQLFSSNDLNIPLIITCKEAPEYAKKSEDFRKLASEMGSNFIYTEKAKTSDIIDEIRELNPDIAISINWINIIKKDLISSFKMGILNAHAGDLPRYRGNACPNWAILNNEKKVVVSIHLMDEGLDTGPIVLKDNYPIDSETKIGDVYDYFNKNIPRLFLKAVKGLESGVITPKKQSTDKKDILRCYPRIPSDSFIDWNKSAIEISKLVKASSEPFNGAYTYLNMERFVIWEAYALQEGVEMLSIPGHVLWKNKKTGEVGISTGDGVLVLRLVEKGISGKVKPNKIIKSLRTRLGLMVEDELFELNKRVEHLENERNGLS